MERSQGKPDNLTLEKGNTFGKITEILMINQVGVHLETQMLDFSEDFLETLF